MAGGKEIRNKIASIENTQKITKAMEMVSASKMLKAQNRMKLGKPYAHRIRSVIGHIANSTPEYRHVYFDTRDVKRLGYIVVSTDRGLCGGLNINLFKATVASMQEWAEKDIEIDICTIGARAATFFNNGMSLFSDEAILYAGTLSVSKKSTALESKGVLKHASFSFSQCFIIGSCHSRGVDASV